jgi:hypothetical protein
MCLKFCKFDLPTNLDVVSKYLKGYSINTIRKEYDVNNEVIKNILLSYDIKIRTISEDHKTKIYKEKIRKTLLNKYGVDNPSKSQIIKKRKEETTLKKYGVINPYQIKRIRINAVKSQNTLEYRKKMSNLNIGDKNANWQGGITPKNKMFRRKFDCKLWRESVFKRDNYTCQKCKIRGLQLQAHHIKNFINYSELRTIIDNGITFCKKDHNIFHRMYGIKNNNIEQVKEFIRGEL